MIINVGVMGQVDSGKTSLLRLISKKIGGVISTAALDKHPQSQERGITIDLGFTSIVLPLNETIASENYQSVCLEANLSQHEDSKHVRICFVDCPGHASLIRSVIGAAQIVDQIVLLIDINKGIQQQTAECLVIAEILQCHLIIVLNKIDFIPEIERNRKIQIFVKKLKTQLLSKTSFDENLPIVPMSLLAETPIGLNEFLNGLRHSVVNNLPQRNSNGSLMFMFDHGFTKKGHGSVLTGTVVSGCLRLGQEVCLAQSVFDKKKIRSIQSFKKPVDILTQGERGGVCVSGLEVTKLERGLLINPADPPPTFSLFIASIKRAPRSKQIIPTRRKYHISVSHSTLTAYCEFFDFNEMSESINHNFDFSKRYHFLNELPSLDQPHPSKIYALIRLDNDLKITCPVGTLLVGSRLDFDSHSLGSRITFYGHVLQKIDSSDKRTVDSIPLSSLFVSKTKSKMGKIDRHVDLTSAIGHGMFASSSHVEKFMGLTLSVEGLVIKGKIDRPFGKNGKFVILFTNDVEKDQIHEKVISLHYVVNIFDPQRKKWDMENLPSSFDH